MSIVIYGTRAQADIVYISYCYVLLIVGTNFSLFCVCVILVLVNQIDCVIYYYNKLLPWQLEILISVC